MSAYGEYGNIRQIAINRIDRLMQTRDAMRDFVARLGSTRLPAFGVTEWNLFLNSSVWQLDRTQTGAVSGGEFLIRALAAQPELPITVATQFALQGGELALLRTQTNSAMSPMGHVFEGFASWTGSHHLPVTVESPCAMAYARDVPYVAASAALSEDASTIYIAMVNNAENQGAMVHVDLGATAPRSLHLRRVAGDTCTSSNERSANDVVLEDMGEEPYRADVELPPCSVLFADYRVEP